MWVPCGSRVAVAASPDAVGGPRATLQLGQLTVGLRGTLGTRGEEAVAHDSARRVEHSDGRHTAAEREGNQRTAFVKGTNMISASSNLYVDTDCVSRPEAGIIWSKEILGLSMGARAAKWPPPHVIPHGS